ncbi:MAG: hypothetical protein NW215_14620 [Hyphomicrobiales bacterium]|nr:hypothetical protein [Hyphomicrobiales bacterium]
MKLKTVMLAIMLSLSAVPAHAQDGAKGPNGGKMATDKGHKLEFVPSATDVKIYTSDPATGAKGRIIIQSGGKTTQITLAPDGSDKLAAPLAAPLEKGAVVAVSVTSADGHITQARFTVD